jgi:hypothetical protein
MPPSRPDPLVLLRELLEADRREGLGWEPENFVQRVWLACRECRARSFIWPIIETEPAWRDAYLGRRSRSPLSNLRLELLDDEAASPFAGRLEDPGG